MREAYKPQLLCTHILPLNIKSPPLSAWFNRYTNTHRFVSQRRPPVFSLSQVRSQSRQKMDLGQPIINLSIHYVSAETCTEKEKRKTELDNSSQPEGGLFNNIASISKASKKPWWTFVPPRHANVAWHWCGLLHVGCGQYRIAAKPGLPEVGPVCCWEARITFM